MKSFKCLALAVFLISSTAFADQGRGGGGGIKRDGVFLTFGSAKVQVKEKSLAAVPGLKELLSSLERMTLEDSYRRELVAAVTPLGSRKYFAIPNNELDPEKRKAFIMAYHEAFKGQVSENSIVVYAFTVGNETFLLPEFFQLTPVRQSVILFHEGLWVVDPKLTYDEVLDAEIKFETYLEKGGSGFDEEFHESLSVVFRNYIVSITAAAIEDLARGRLDQVFNYVGEDAIVSGKDKIWSELLYGKFLGTNYTPNAAPHLVLMMREFPEVQLFRQLYAFRDFVSVRGTAGCMSYSEQFVGYTQPWKIQRIPAPIIQHRSGNCDAGMTWWIPHQ